MPLSGRRLAAPIKIFSQKNLPFNVQGLDRLKIWKYKIAPTTLQRNIFKMIISHWQSIIIRPTPLYPGIYSGESA